MKWKKFAISLVVNSKTLYLTAEHSWHLLSMTWFDILLHSMHVFTYIDNVPYTLGEHRKKMLKNTVNTFKFCKFPNNQTIFNKICRKISGFNDDQSK